MRPGNESPIVHDSAVISGTSKIDTPTLTLHARGASTLALMLTRLPLAPLALAVLTLLSGCKKLQGAPLTKKGEPVKLGCDAPIPAALSHEEGRAVDYVVTCMVPVHTSLTIGPGTALVFQANAGFVVEQGGSLAAKGTAAAPITMTGEGGARWHGVHVFTAAPQNELTFVRVKDAGAARVDWKGAILATGEGALTVRDTTVEAADTHALAVTDGGKLRAVERSSFSAKGDTPALVSPDAIGKLAKNSFKGGAGASVRVELTNDPPRGDQTWAKLDVPYRIAAGRAVQLVGKQTFSPGVTVLFEDGAGLVVHGALVARGTPTEKIRFRPVTSGSARHAGLALVEKGNVLEHCEIAGGGADKSDDAGNVVLSGDSGGADLTISECLLEGSGGYGLVAHGQPVKQGANVVFRSNAKGTTKP